MVNVKFPLIAYLTRGKTSGDVQEETETELWGEFFSLFQGDDEESSKEPVSDLSYPILDDTSHVRSFDSSNNSALGIVSATIFWRTMLRYVTAAVVMMLCSKLKRRSSPHPVPTTDLTQEYSLRRFHWYSYCL
jgi:hypothetical protein